MADPGEVPQRMVEHDEGMRIRIEPIEQYRKSGRAGPPCVVLERVKYLDDSAAVSRRGVVRLVAWGGSPGDLLGDEAKVADR